MISTNFVPSVNNTWEDYDVYTNLSVPKSSVAEVMIENNNGASSENVGVRANGSSLNRYIPLHEAEGGGGTHYSLCVQVDSNGYIEIYTTDTGKTEFYIVGYFEGVTYTETMTAAWTIGQSSGWVDKNLNTDYGYPVSRVHEVILVNGEADVSNIIGLRINGSSVDRKFKIHEPEGGGFSVMSTFVESDNSGIIEGYSEDNNLNYMYFTGYFDSATSFTERQDTLDTAGDAGWEDEALNGYGVPSGAVCAVLCLNAEAGTENELGVRDDATAISRLFDEHEAEPGTNEWTGFRMCVNAGTDASRTIDIYEEDTSESILYLHGWFTWAAGPVGTNAAFSIIPLMVATGMIA